MTIDTSASTLDTDSQWPNKDLPMSVSSAVTRRLAGQRNVRSVILATALDTAVGVGLGEDERCKAFKIGMKIGRVLRDNKLKKKNLWVILETH